MNSSGLEKQITLYKHSSLIALSPEQTATGKVK